MTLDADITARLSTERLAQLTNPQGRQSSAVDTVRLALAAADVDGAFRMYAGVVYDSDNILHPELGVRGVEIYLRRYVGQDNSTTALDAWKKELQQLRKVSANDRFALDTQSELTVSDEAPQGRTVRPYSDRTEFEGYGFDTQAVSDDDVAT